MDSLSLEDCLGRLRYVLSIPLNGFKVWYNNSGGRPILRPFNSIEWILAHLASRSSFLWKALSIPLNGFQTFKYLHLWLQQARFQFHWMDSCSHSKGSLYLYSSFQFHWMDSQLLHGRRGRPHESFQFHWMDSCHCTGQGRLGSPSFQFHWMDS